MKEDDGTTAVDEVTVAAALVVMTSTAAVEHMVSTPQATTDAAGQSCDDKIFKQ